MTDQEDPLPATLARIIAVSPALFRTPAKRSPPGPGYSYRIIPRPCGYAIVKFYARGCTQELVPLSEIPPEHRPRWEDVPLCYRPEDMTGDPPYWIERCAEKAARAMMDQHQETDED